VSPCHYGIDTPRGEELIASRHSISDIRRFLEVDSLHYLELERLLRAAGGGRPEGFCTACYTGKYPTPIPDYERPEAKAHSRKGRKVDAR
jgi:amidophosphoribosyltransferase